MGKVLAVCISEKKGTQKKPVPEITLKEDWGIVGDAHAGHWHRQVSLLAFEKIDEFRKKGAEVDFGAFGENIVCEGFDLKTLPVGTRFRIGDCLLELSQIGKACHSHCEIYKVMGDCIMPREGVFTVVLKGGVVRPGMEIEMVEPDPARPFTAAVITLSDRASQGIYEDKSGPEIKRILEEKGYQVVEQFVLPDGKPRLMVELSRLADQRQVNVIFTTGGTGFSERDQTPEATKEVSDREVPGIGEALRAYSMQFTKNAILSRQTAGIRKKTLIINMPGSPKACREDLEYLLPSLEHGIGILRGTATD
ncbi:MAG: molybdenum cofactor synthesis domain-containing protein [Oribacterium sp.]|jgi:molybdenum cofactor synthesis domain-containing protein|nr:molybdenum cofactor synthesis domain-containing protein [Oribacterium sp.]MDY6307932.1 molybdenum cofactor synthesis domain-containing protein [Oribacterium sp.]MDY6316781.1 molybdenum cofactor synthesis domain-containing protein [Oribacterium sp.]